MVRKPTTIATGSGDAEGMGMAPVKTRPDTLCSATFLPYSPFGYVEWIILGSIAGGIGGFFGGAIAGEMELSPVFSILLTPPLTVVGATCGYFAKKHGWRVVRPVCWAIIGAIVYGMYSPEGWIVAGVVGGSINGFRYRSLPKFTMSAALGGVVGTIGWLMVTGYLISMVSILDG